jgi:hypothetical protein
MENKPSSKYYLIGAIVLVVIIVAVVLAMGKSKSGGLKNEPVNLVGNWVSATVDKGMQGSGNISIFNTTAKIDVSGDIGLTIDKVENNIAYGTVTFNNLCYTSSRSAAGDPPKCVESISKAIQSQITGDKLTFESQTVLGVNLNYEASFTNNSITGTFTRVGNNTKIKEDFSGTFSLVRAKK